MSVPPRPKARRRPITRADERGRADEVDKLLTAAVASGDRGILARFSRIGSIVTHAEAVFGDEQKAFHWLATPLPFLGDRSPVQILAGGGDGEEIDKILTRIEHNIPS